MKLKRPAKLPDIETQVRLAAATKNIRYTSHANERMFERKIIRAEVEFILANGKNEPAKDEFKKITESWNYAFRGKTVDKRELRIAVIFDPPDIIVITTIDLDK